MNADPIKTRRWPSGSEYAIAVQDPTVFEDATLKTASLRTDMLGMPASRSGQSAIVFEVTTGDLPTAVRCFTSPPSDGKVRYDALAEHLRSTPCPPLVPAAWIEQGVNVNGQWFPVVKMEWAPGRPLNLFVEDHLDEPDVLIELAKRWTDCVYALERAGLAHGDLQHGNVLVDNDLRIRLVDLDGVWVPALDGIPPREFGHPNYQHPARDPATWGRDVDAFSALAVYVALRALAVDPELWDRFNNGENLLFTRTDFERPGETELWAALDQSNDVEVAVVAALLRSFCGLQPKLPTQLSFILRTRSLPAGTPLAQSAGPLTGKTSTEWWVEDGATTYAGASSAGEPAKAVPKRASTTVADLSPPTESPSIVLSPSAAARVARSSLKRKRLVGLGTTTIRAGLLGGLVAGAVAFAVHASSTFDSNTASLVVLVSTVAVLLGAMLNAWQSAVSGSASALWEAVLGGAVATGLGLAALGLGDAIYRAAVDKPGDPIVIVVGVVWALVGASIGFGIGLARWSFSRASWGFVGGAWGGLVGGLLFGATAASVDPKRSGLLVGDELATFAALVVAAMVIGLCIGVADRVRRRLWLQVIEGPTRGMEFILDRSSSTIGARGQDVNLTGDVRIERKHAVIDQTGDELWIELLAEADIDGELSVGRCAVQDGATVRFGETYVKVHRR